MPALPNEPGADVDPDGDTQATLSPADVVAWAGSARTRLSDRDLECVAGQDRRPISDSCRLVGIGITLEQRDLNRDLVVPHDRFLRTAGLLELDEAEVFQFL